MSAHSDPRRAHALDVDSEYYYRRSLTLRELVPAIGAAAAAAAVTFYLVKLFLERTPLEATSRSSGGGTRLTLHRSGGSAAAAKSIGRR